MLITESKKRQCKRNMDTMMQGVYSFLQEIRIEPRIIG